MKVEIKSVTQPLDGTTPEQFVAYVARVSNPKNQNNTESAPKLLRYLIDHKHWSPFELVHITMEIETTRAIGRQVLRHRSFSFSEMSQRYQQVTDFEEVKARRQDTKNRQNSIDDLSPETQEWFAHGMESVQGVCERFYKEALAAGVAKECARMILPESTRSRIYMSGSLRSWIHYLQVRLDPSTQLEHREVAHLCFEEIKKLFPDTMEAVFPENI